MKTRNKLLILGILGGFVGILCLGFYSVGLLLTPDLSSKRGSYAYWLCVDNLIKHIPEVDIVGESKFRTSPMISQAATKPEFDEICYISRASQSTIESQVDEYLQKRGLKKEEGHWVQDEKRKVYMVEYHPDPRSSGVCVFLETYD